MAIRREKEYLTRMTMPLVTSKEKRRNAVVATAIIIGGLAILAVKVNKELKEIADECVTAFDRFW